MEALPHLPIVSYPKLWEEQKNETWHRTSDEGEDDSFISTTERKESPQKRYESQAEAQSHHFADDNFDLPNMDAFPSSVLMQEMKDQQAMPKEDEFVDAAAFIMKNELEGEDSFSNDIETLAIADWDQMNTSGRPSDFFESKSRNLDHVELSSPRNADDPLFENEKAHDFYEESKKYTSTQQQLSPTDPKEGLALHDRFDQNLGLSRSSTASSSGFDLHFDNTRFMYTPNSLRYLQEKSRLRGAVESHVDDESNHSLEDYIGEAEAVTRKLSSLSDQTTSEGSISEYVATLQKGPGIIKESLREIGAIIDHSNRLVSSLHKKNDCGIELPENEHEITRDFVHPLESMLPLSRTTDSWGEDMSVARIDDDGSRQSLERLPNGIEISRQTINFIRRSRSQETPELDTIRENSNVVKTDCVSLRLQPANRSSTQPRSHAHKNNNPESNIYERRSGKVITSEFDVNSLPCGAVSFSPSERVESKATLGPFDQSLAEVAATQNPFGDGMSRSKADICRCASDEECGDVVDNSSVIRNHKRQDRLNKIRVNDEGAGGHRKDMKWDDFDSNSVQSRYSGSSQHSWRSSWSNHVESRRGEIDIFDSRTTEDWKRPVATDSRLVMPNCNKHFMVKEPAMIPRRCRRLLCSVGDIMTEQIFFTNGSNSVGRICTFLIPLSTGCQQFSVSPAVLELGPKASSAFHVTFKARYAGTVSGIFQFRGIGVESLLHPYEVIIEASVKQHCKLENQRNTTSKRQDEDVTTASERVQELHASSSADRVEVSPTFIRFDRVQNKDAKNITRKARLRLLNNTAHALSFKVRTLDNIWARPATGMIEPASEVLVSVLPISQPLAQHCGNTNSIESSQAEDWIGSVTIKIGKSYLREVSVVVDRQIIKMLPLFDEVARFQHQLSSQTDSFYYTKRGNRKGLYFHARAVEFGCCNIGEKHEVPVYICNGSNEPMTVFLQDLQEPFSCAYTTTTIKPRKFIEVVVTFTSKVVGKVATSLFAYSVTDKAVVTLVARGI